MIVVDNFVERAGWAKGPWDDEPDKLTWRTKSGLPGMIVRAELTGSLCGYAAVPPGHPWHGRFFTDPDILMRISVHGGLTYSEACQGRICHSASAGEEDDVWWFGFDCAHAFDLAPALMANSGLPRAVFHSYGVYRGVPYVRGEVESLAKQLSTIGEEP